ncbi:methyl-accepting chemotaxis protein [Candidatus Marinarcus aquaticus]|uniref:Chemotaxis protein n=1 Tax=Candidatus Marinarcus aquaticus TaxID=2044504 RepID=A0A4Q0XSG3_9BACT|nr:PAS domain-containing methyl-accepting chemotaxis protein [Candidatus Marinarcus aquaticus]RXJ56165.1 chemotaxis protein [Candidatus Marinarcus aquaticus]
MSWFKKNNQEDEAKLHALDMNYAVISFSNSGTILDANQNFVEALGYDNKSEFVGQHHRIFCDKTYVNTQEYEEFWTSLNKGQTNTSEFRRIRKDGKSIYIQASYIPIKNSSGKVIKVVKFAQDITEKKLESLDYEGQLQAISKSQAVIEFNMDGTIITANDNFLNTLHYELKDVMGKHHQIFCENTYVNSNEYKEFWKKLNRGEFDSGEYLRLGKNGERVWIQATYNPIFDIDNKPFKVVKYATDITERKNLIFDIDKKVHTLTQSLDNLSTASTSMSKGAEVTMHGSQEITVSITQMNEAVSALSEKIEAMVSSIGSIASASSQGEKVAKEAQEQSQITTEAMTRLNNESEKIGDTINVITQIAFQTNILSLNAAVEAATAGEAGKGFAVVAQEVRNLATRSDEAAKQITAAIELIQSLVKDSLGSINKIDSTIAEITTMSGQISSSIEEQQNISNDLASTALETSQGVNEITNTMKDVSNSAEESGVQSRETATATETLIEVSSELIEILKKLK